MNTWVDEQLKDFIRSAGYGEEVEKCLRRGTSCLAGNIVIRVNFHKRSVIIANTSERKKHKYGKAVCRKGEQFNARTGFAIAWARYKGEEAIPDDFYSRMLGELPTGTKIKLCKTGPVRTVLAQQENAPLTVIESIDGIINQLPTDTLVIVV